MGNLLSACYICTARLYPVTVLGCRVSEPSSLTAGRLDCLIPWLSVCLLVSAWVALFLGFSLTFVALSCVCVYECALGLQALWQVISMRCFIAPLNVSLNLNQFLCKVEKLLKYGYIIGLTRCEFAEFILKLVDFQFQNNKQLLETRFWYVQIEDLLNMLISELF